MKSCLIALVLLAPAALGQTQGTYTTFGRGCPGTGGSPMLPGVVLPASYDVKFGNGDNYWGVGRPQERYQQMFLATEIGKNYTFTGYQLRPDDQHPSSFGGTQPYAVYLGYTSKTLQTLSSTYADNYDTTSGAPKRVFQGIVNLPPVAATPPQLNDWTFSVRFSTPWPYSYNASENLLFELTNSSNSGVSGQKDAVAGATANTSRVSTGNGPTSPSGTVYRNSGLVMKFNTSQVGIGAVPILSATTLPNIGKWLTVTLAQAKPDSAAALVVGTSRSAWGTIPLPLDLTGAGASGCSLLVSMDILFALPVDSSGDTFGNLFIPNDQALRAVQFHNQWLVVDPGVNKLGIAFSNGGTATIGG